MQHGGNVENQKKMVSWENTFLECSQMAGVLYHSVIHGLGFFICFIIYGRKTGNKTRFFYILFKQ